MSIQYLFDKFEKDSKKINWKPGFLDIVTNFVNISKEAYKISSDISKPDIYSKLNDVIINLYYFNKHWDEDKGSFICKECHRPELGTYTKRIANRMRKNQLCFFCDFWETRAEEIRKNPNIFLLIDHHMYTDAGYVDINAYTGDKSHLGYGGRLFTYRLLLDGTTRTTNNLWFGGCLPEKYWKEIPDNAEFVKEKT